jgi:drug/metabolite transporter (DMT)-like permease
MKTTILVIAMVSFTIAANLLMKLGANAPAERRILGLLSGQALSGIAMFGIAMLLYLWILHRLPLNLAQGFAAVQFIGVILGAWLILGESIPPLRWFFLLLLAAGILGAGLTATSASNS